MYSGRYVCTKLANGIASGAIKPGPLQLANKKVNKDSMMSEIDKNLMISLCKNNGVRI